MHYVSVHGCVNLGNGLWSCHGILLIVSSCYPLILDILLIAFVQDEAKYLVFDGDVDAVWVENMNSVMDDNKLLTLPNGERIRLQPHCRLLFEVRASQSLGADA